MPEWLIIVLFSESVHACWCLRRNLRYMQTALWESLCRKRKVMLVSQCSHCARGKKGLCCHQHTQRGDWGHSCEEKTSWIAMWSCPPSIQPSPSVSVCLFVRARPCCCWLCCFTSCRLRHVWFRRSDRCRGENHQQQTQDQRQRGKSSAVTSSSCLCLKASLTRSNTRTESSDVKAQR